jgi:hypothetical protein
MKIFKRGSMMQEHRQHQVSQRGNKGQLESASPNFEITLKLMRHLN